MSDGITWPEWLEVLQEIGVRWPHAQSELLAVGDDGQYAMRATHNDWWRLVADYTAEEVYSAIYWYAEHSDRSEFYPQGPTIARYAKMLRDRDRQAAKAAAAKQLPAPDPNAMTATEFARSRGFDTYTAYRLDRCKSQGHYGFGTDGTCRQCNGLPPWSVSVFKELVS